MDIDQLALSRLHEPAQPRRPARAADGREQWASFTRRNADAQSPAGGASSTARDMAQWLRLLLNDGQHDGKQVVDKAALDQAHVPAIVRGVDPQTGAACLLRPRLERRLSGARRRMEPCRRLLGRRADDGAPGPGRAARHRRAVERLPERRARGHRRDLLRPVFTGSPARDWVALANEVFEAGYKEMMKPSEAYATPPASPAPPLPNPPMPETIATTMSATPRSRTPARSAVPGPRPRGQRRFPLTPFNRDLFVYSPVAEAPQARMGVTFLIGPTARRARSRSRTSTTTDWDAGAGRRDVIPVRVRESLTGQVRWGRVTPVTRHTVWRHRGRRATNKKHGCTST